MSAGSSHQPSNAIDASDVEVEIIFEAGRTRLSIAEIARLAPGQVLTIAGLSPGQVDLVVGDRRIGRAQIVDVDGATGFEITELRQPRAM